MNRLILILLLTIFCSPIHADNATNVRARQEGNTVIITYDLSAKSNVKVFSAINNSNDFKELKSVTGDVGWGVNAGNNLTIVWWVLEDYEDLLVEDVRFKVEAEDYSSLKVSEKNYIFANASGVTEYITVESDQPWEIKKSSSSMFNTSRIGDIIKVTINPNNKGRIRDDSFYIKTKDKKESVKIILSQAAKYKYKPPTIYHEYCNNVGTFEIIYVRVGGGICTGVSMISRLLSFRLGPILFNPLELSVGRNFITKTKADYYTPSLEFLIPFREDWAFFVVGGPSLDLNTVKEVKKWGPNIFCGVHWTLGGPPSVDMFLRYNGSFQLGVSINVSTGF